MRHTTLGRLTGLRVSQYALGTANFGTAWGGGADVEQARKVFERFAEAGGTFIDTADCYNFGEAEHMLGEFLGAERDRFVLASKYGYGASSDAGIAGTGNSRKSMVTAVEASLRRLGTDYLDLYWAHFPDPGTPTEEILAAFDHLVRAGKVLHAGLSNFPAWQVARAATIAELRGTAPIVAVQVEYSLAERTAERDVLPMAAALGLGAAVWSPLGGGLLTGKYRRSTTGRLRDWQRVVHREDTEQKTAVLDTVLAVAQECACPPGQVAVAWLLGRAQRSPASVVPVIGPRDVEQLDGYLDALTLHLSDDQRERLDAASAPTLGVPHEIARSVRDTVSGGDAAGLDVPAVPVA